MPTLDEQSLSDVLQGYQQYRLPTAAEAILTGDFSKVIPPQISQVISSVTATVPGTMVPMTPQTASIQQPLPVGIQPERQTPFYNPAGAHAGELPAMYAQSMARSAGMPTMNLPNPIYMTNPQMGVFRPQQQSNFFANIPNLVGNFMRQDLSLYSTVPNISTMRFHTPEAALGSRDILRQQVGLYDNAGIMESISTGLARSAITGIGTTIGTIAGAGIGGVGGAVEGAQWGSMIASLVSPFIDRPFAQAINFMARPALLNRARAIRLGLSSKQFVTGGANLDVFGRGLNVPAAARLNRGLEELRKGFFKDLNQEDVVSMTQMAGEAGLLNMAQNPDQIVKDMKGVIKAVGAIAKVTGDPDVRNAIKAVAQMRQYGLTTQEAESAFQNARTFARMAGLSVEQVMSGAGMRGASMAQQAGLTAGMGLNMGVGSAGMAKGAIGGRSFSVQDLALYGGEGGVEQRINQAFMGILTGAGRNFLPGLVKFGPGGPTLDQSKLQQLVSGRNLQELMSRPALSGQQLQQIINNRDKLLDTMGRNLGPYGMLQTIGSIGKWLQQQTGGNMTLTSALTAAGMDTKTARMFAQMLQNPETFRNMIQQERVTQRMNALEQAREIEQRHGYVRRTVIDRQLRTGRENLTAFKSTVYDPVEEWLVGSDLERQYEEMGLKAYEFDALGGSQKTRSLLARTMFKRTSATSAEEPPELSRSGYVALKGAFGTRRPIAWLMSVAGGHRARTGADAVFVKTYMREMSRSGSALIEGATASPGSTVDRIEALSKYIPTKTIDTSIQTIKDALRTDAKVSQWTFGMKHLDFGYLHSRVLEHLSRDPKFKNLSKPEQEKLVKDMIAEAMNQLSEEDPELAKDIKQEVSSTLLKVTGGLQEGTYESMQDRLEMLDDQIKDLTGAGSLFGAVRDKPGEVANKVVGLIASVQKEGEESPTAAMAKIALYTSMRGASPTERAAIIKQLGGKEEYARIQRAMKASGVEDILRKLKLKGPVATTTMKALMYKSLERGQTQLATNVAMALQKRAAKKDITVDLATMSPDELIKYVREHAGMFGLSKERLQGSRGEVFDYLQQELEVGSVFATEGEQMQEAGVSISPGDTKNIKQIKQLRDMFARPVSQMTDAANAQVSAANIMLEAARAFRETIALQRSESKKDQAMKTDEAVKNKTESASPG